LYLAVPSGRELVGERVGGFPHLCGLPMPDQRPDLGQLARIM